MDGVTGANIALAGETLTSVAFLLHVSGAVFGLRQVAKQDPCCNPPSEQLRCGGMSEPSILVTGPFAMPSSSRHMP